MNFQIMPEYEPTQEYKDLIKRVVKRFLLSQGSTKIDLLVTVLVHNYALMTELNKFRAAAGLEPYDTYNPGG